MSIINEALKKTEEHLQRNVAKDNSLPDKPSRPKSFLLYILILLTGLLLGNLIFTLLRHKPQGDGLASTSQSHKSQDNGLASSNQSHKPQGNGLASTSTQAPSLPSPIKDALPIIQTTNLPPPPILPNQPPEEKKSAAQANFVLNGIFFSDNDGYALVNNQIVRKNDRVDGAKVSLITANSVELDNAGQTITLTTRR